mgnify:CR=1 FL=1
MNDEDLLDTIVNAFGSPHFNSSEVIQALHEAAGRLKEEGKQTGSILAVMNTLPEIESEAKKRY